jgi:hypothetical protein
MRRVKTRVLEALPVSLSVGKASKRCQAQRTNSASLQSLHAHIRIEDRVVTSKPVCQKWGVS